MRRLGLFLGLFVIACSSAPLTSGVQASNPEPQSALPLHPGGSDDGIFCSALDRLADIARRTATTQQVTLFKPESDLSVACGPIDVEALSAYCDVALKSVSVEFTHGYPWLVRECLETAGMKPDVQLVDESTGLVGRNKIIRLESELAAGGNLLLTFAASDGAISRAVPNYGRWELTVRP